MSGAKSRWLSTSGIYPSFGYILRFSCLVNESVAALHHHHFTVDLHNEFFFVPGADEYFTIAA